MVGPFSAILISLKLFFSAINKFSTCHKTLSVDHCNFVLQSLFRSCFCGIINLVEWVSKEPAFVCHLRTFFLHFKVEIFFRITFGSLGERPVFQCKYYFLLRYFALKHLKELIKQTLIWFLDDFSLTLFHLRSSVKACVAPFNVID